MSLIHDALREMEKDTAPSMAGVHRPLTRPPASTSHGLLFVAGFAAIVLVALAGWWFWQKNQLLPLAGMSSLAQAPVPPGPSASPIGPGIPSVAPASASEAPLVASSANAFPGNPLPDSINRGATTSIPPLVGGPAPAAKASHPRASAASGRMNPANGKAIVRPPVTPVAAEEVPLERRYALFLQAMKTDDLAGAREHLLLMQRLLPEGTLSRLRAEAWFALKSGNELDARRSYLEVLDRAPGDEEASINLASMESRNGHREKARQILSDALGLNTGSEALTQALSRFRAPAAN